MKRRTFTEETSKSSRCEARVQTPTPPERCPSTPLGFTGTLHNCGGGIILQLDLYIYILKKDQSFTVFAGQMPTTSDTTTCALCCFLGGIMSNASSRTTWACYEDNGREKKSMMC